eukprot:6419704-Pyramimonas_sp.AAC.1
MQPFGATRQVRCESGWPSGPTCRSEVALRANLSVSVPSKLALWANSSIRVGPSDQVVGVTTRYSCSVDAPVS